MRGMISAQTARRAVWRPLWELPRRFDLICNRLFTQAARRRAGGGGCVRLLTATAKDIRRPRIVLVSVSLEDGGRAAARVRTTSVGQKEIEETIHLRRERGAYRIEALG